ncbi:MAG: hypothetical protein K0U82_18860, partial [Planctomycetes bacterium]|nr:hypothetical protein [Planctomycetota bacterium]
HSHSAVKTTQVAIRIGTSGFSGSSPMLIYETNPERRKSEPDLTNRTTKWIEPDREHITRSHIQTGSIEGSYWLIHV